MPQEDLEPRRMSTQVEQLRLIEQESLRVQRGGNEPIECVDVSRALSDIGRQF